MRYIVLDTETTGMPAAEGHRIVEIGCVELEGRTLTGRHFHVYLQPDRESDPEALKVHGITSEFLRDKPRFAEVADDFFEFIKGACLIIHNAAFDISFMESEFRLIGQHERTSVRDYCEVLDTLELAKQLHPGQRNNLDALCRRYDIDNSGRELHGALLDAQILAEVYLAMTGGQTDLMLAGEEEGTQHTESGLGANIRRLSDQRPSLKVLQASSDELQAHQQKIAEVSKAAKGPALWEQFS